MSALPGLLLLHGVGDSGACWGPFVARLRAADEGALAELDVSTPDAPAHGDHEPTPEETIAAPDQLAVAVRHADELARRTGGPVVVGGHSMGATVALAFAAARPDLTRALWLEDPPFSTSMGDNDAADPDELVDVSEFRDWFDELKARDLTEVVALARVEHPGWDQGEYEPWARAKRAVHTDAFAHPVPWIGAGWAARARSIAVPTVMVIGDPEQGGIVNPTAADELAALPVWTVHRLPASHDVRRDNPLETVALLARLIQSVAT